MAIKAKLQFLTGAQKGKVVNVEKLPLLIGRVEGCDIVLAGDPGVSRKHAELRLEEGRVIVTDLGSSGGTTVNQQKISGEQPLKAGDVIGVGKCQIRIALPASKPGAAPAKPKPAEDQEGTAFVDMAKMMSGGGDQEGTAFVDMDKFVEDSGGDGAQDGTAAVDMSKLAGQKSLGEKWRELPPKKKLILAGGGGVLGLALLLVVVSSVTPKPKEPILEQEVVTVKVDETKHLTIPRSKEVAASDPNVVIAWLDEGADSIAQVRGVEEGEAQLTVTTREGDIHIWNVAVEGYDDPYKGLTPQQRLERGRKSMEEGDQKAKLAEGDVEKAWYAFQAYYDAWQYLSGAQFAPPELVKDAEKKKLEYKKVLDEARTKYEQEYANALQMEQWDRVLLALESLTRIYPDLEDPRHQRYMYLIRQMKERRSGR